MDMTFALAQLSTCRRRAAGCILVDKNYEVLGQGYNGNPKGEAHCLDHPCPGVNAAPGTELDACEAMHAEWNALQRCRDYTKIWTAFVTVEPCVTCVKMLLNTPCQRVVFVQTYATAGRTRWGGGGRLWVQLNQARLDPLEYRDIGNSKESPPGSGRALTVPPRKVI